MRIQASITVERPICEELEGFFRLAGPMMQPMARRQVQHDLETFRDLMNAHAL